MDKAPVYGPQEEPAPCADDFRLAATLLAGPLLEEWSLAMACKASPPSEMNDRVTAEFVRRARAIRHVHRWLLRQAGGAPPPPPGSIGPLEPPWDYIATAPQTGTKIWVTSNFADGYIVAVTWFVDADGTGHWIDEYTDTVKGDNAAFWCPYEAIVLP